MITANLTTLCYIEHEGRYLMLHRIKKEHDINKDKWIGIGGHFEPGESPEECLLREVKEETGLTLTSYIFRGFVTFIADDEDMEYMCLFTADQYTGELIECKEGTLEWIEKDKILNLNIWEGDRIFLDLIKSDSPFFSLKLHYRKNHLIEAFLDGTDITSLASSSYYKKC